MKKTIAFALAGALAAGTALVTAANAQSGFSVSVGSPGYYDDYGWGSGWGYGYRPVHSWGGGAVVGAPAYGYYDAPAVTTTTRVVRTAPDYGYYDEPAVATTRTVVAQRPAYRTSRVVRSQKVVYRLLKRPTPFAFPLMVERFREQLTTEKLSARIERMVADLERAAT